MMQQSKPWELVSLRFSWVRSVISTAGIHTELFPFLQVQTEDSVLLFVVAWTITEIIRYSFYTFSLLNHLPYLIKWAR